MSIQLNIGDHTSSQAGYISIPHNRLAQCQWARTKAKWIARNIASANVYFKGLPGARSLTELLNDRTIWVNYHATFTYFGETNFVGGKEIAIGNNAFRIGRWTVLATLIHELAHSNGAPGQPSKAAEESLLHCGLGKQSEKTGGVDDSNTPYEPGISG